MKGETVAMEPSAAPGRLCGHFGVCGGCATQDVPYEAQLAAKQERLRALLEPLVGPSRFRPIRPSPDVFFYRNKMEFAFGGRRGEPVTLGLREKGRFDRVVDVRECFLLSPETGALLDAVRRWAAAEGLSGYHPTAHKGFLRYLVVREGKNTGERLVHLVTAAGELPRGSFLDAMTSSGVRVDTVVWSVNDGPSDVARGGEGAVLRGDGWLRETLGGKTFRISPTGFFQTNTRGAEVLYAIVADLLGPSVTTLFDVYCGAGAIGLFCAGAAERVVGVELHAPSVADATANARAQGAGHAEFHAMDASAFAARPATRDLWDRPGAAVVVDPPRPGLSTGLRRLLTERPVERCVYVSCNPESLARDLVVLRGVYEVDAAAPVDLFPHTPHVETVVRLTRRAA